MKKSDKIILAFDIILGIALLVIGLTIQVDYYSTMLFAMGFALTVNSILQFVRFYHHTRPENAEAYQEKLRRRDIDLKDERKVQLRNRAGYVTWIATMAICFIASFMAALFRADALVVLVLAGAAVAQYVMASITYKYLCRKM